MSAPNCKAPSNYAARRKRWLVIAKLDRLSRNLAFIANLMESGVDFVACDMPTANKTMLQIMAVFAEHEREAISQRTKDALQAAKSARPEIGQSAPRCAHHEPQARRDHARVSGKDVSADQGAS